MASTELFTVPIPALGAHPGGAIVCTVPAPKVYLLTFTSPADNRQTPAFCAAMLAALDIIEFEQEPGVVVTTSGIGKFYSNGLDLDIAVSTPGYWEDSLFPLYRRFLTYPRPTVALLNGHAFAGGAMLAMHHDYRVFTGSGRGYLCVNELDFGAPLPPPLSAIFRLKVAPHVYRELVLEAKRFDAKAALHAGLVDAVGEMDAVLALIKERNLLVKGTTGVYGDMKEEMYKESVALLDVKGPLAAGKLGLKEDRTAAREAGKERVRKWRESQGQKAKL